MLLGMVATFSSAFATVDPGVSRGASSGDNVTGKELPYYQKALARIEQTRMSGARLDGAFYNGLNWVGKTALINYSCSTLNQKSCRAVLGLGVEDKAMVVRDHALRLILANASFSKVEKQRYAKRIVEDYRNYRGTVSLWIVERAQKFLNGSKS
jgi:hypothetical protein